MRRSPQQSTLTKPGRLASVALGLLVVLGATSTAQAEDLQGRANLFWQRFDGDLQTSEGFAQDYDLWFNRAVSESLRYRLRFGALLSDDSLDGAGESLDSEVRGYEAAGRLFFNLPKLSLRTQYEGFNTSFDNGVSTNRTLERSTAQLNWRPDRMPLFTLSADRRRVTIDSVDRETDDLSLFANVSKVLGPWRLSGSARSTQQDDQFGEASRSKSLLGEVAYTDSFYDGRLSTSARMWMQDSTFEQRMGVDRTTPGRQARIERLLTVIDPTPNDARDVTPAPEPRLIDALFVPTGIDLGLTGQSFLNVALDLGRLLRVDRVLLYVRDPSGNPVATGGPLDWGVYVSDDELDWVRLSAGVSTRFDPARSLYEVTVPRVTTRLIKLVNFGLNILDTDLVEVEAFEASNTLRAEELETDQMVTTFQGNVTARPASRTRLSWTGRWNSAESAPERGMEQRTDDSYHTLSAAFEPTDRTDLVLSYSLRDENLSSGVERDFDQVAANVILRPRDGVDMVVGATTSREQSPFMNIDRDGVRFQITTFLWRALNISFDTGQHWSNQRAPVEQDLTQRHANLWADWQLNRQVRLTTTLTTSRNEIEAPGILTDPVQENHRWWLETFWIPGPPLTIRVRTGNANGEDFSADIRRYQVQWNPFRGGTLRIGIIYDEDVDIATNRTFRRLLLDPGWQLNPHARLNISYSRYESTGVTEQRGGSFTFTLTLRT